MEMTKKDIIGIIANQSMLSFYVNPNDKPSLSSYVGFSCDENLNLYFWCNPKQIRNFPIETDNIEIRMLGIPGKILPKMDNQFFIRGTLLELKDKKDIEKTFMLYEQKKSFDPTWSTYKSFKEKYLKGTIKATRFFQFIPSDITYINKDKTKIEFTLK